MTRITLYIIFFVATNNLFSQVDYNRCMLHADSLFDFLKSTCELEDGDYERFFSHSSEHEVSFDFLISGDAEGVGSQCNISQVSYSLVLLKLKLAVQLNGIHNLNISSMKLLACTDLFTDYIIEINDSLNLTFRFDLRRNDMVKIIDVFTEDNKSVFDLTK